MKKENRIFLLTLVCAIVANFLFQQDEVYKITIPTLIILSIVLAIGSIWLFYKRRIEGIICIMGILTLLLIRVVCHIRSIDGNNLKWILEVTIVAGVVLTALFLFIFSRKTIDENTVFILLSVSLMIRMMYIVMTQAHLFQNDIGSFGEESVGHLGYTYYLYANNHLIDFDPREWNQFYHPPLNYIVMAVWAKINILLGISVEHIDEQLQILPFIYSMFTLGYLYKIGKRLGMTPKGICLVLLPVAFFPVSIMMSGGLNNDALLILFMVMSIYYTIFWYYNPKWKNIIGMAISIGCAIMTKLSGGLLAPAMAFLMLLQLYRNRGKWLFYVKQFMVFGLIAFPLGLWFYIRNIILFKVPINYVPLLPEEMDQFIGMFTKTQRLLDVKGQFDTLSIQWSNALPNVDHNIFISIFKFSTFGEGVFYVNNPIIKFIGTGLFWMVVVILVLLPILFLIRLIQNRNDRNIRSTVIFFGIASATIFLLYVKFCFAFPHICTMHVRYIYVAILIGFLFLGMVKKENKLLQKGGTIFLGVFAIFSMLMHINLQILL